MDSHGGHHAMKNGRAAVYLALSMGLTFLIGGGVMVLFWHVQQHPFLVAKVISRKEAIKLPGQGQYCGGTYNCQPPLVCVAEANICVTSECQTDTDCPQGTLCRLAAVVKGKGMVQLCALSGVRKEGEPCWSLAESAQEACAPELLCTLGVCRSRCDPHGHSTCPPGTACWTVEDRAPVCIPSCQEQGCPDEQRCYILQKEHSVCGPPTPLGVDCQKHPCGNGQECRSSRRADTVWMGCVTPCKTAQECPRGDVCSLGLCYARCDLHDKTSCHGQCFFFPPEDDLGLCGPH